MESISGINKVLYIHPSDVISNHLELVYIPTECLLNWYRHWLHLFSLLLVCWIHFCRIRFPIILLVPHVGQADLRQLKRWYLSFLWQCKVDKQLLPLLYWVGSDHHFSDGQGILLLIYFWMSFFIIDVHSSFHACSCGKSSFAMMSAASLPGIL